MIVLAGADLVLPDRIVSSGTLTFDDGRITEIRSDLHGTPPAPFAFHGHTVVPGFIDVHVHGVCGTDSLDPGESIARIAAMLPRFGVTAFCPTTVACGPADLGRVLDQVRRCRESPPAHAARVLPAHLESNFISPAYRGAQPLHSLRVPPRHADVTEASNTGTADAGAGPFSARDILQVIAARRPDIGVVTVSPELEGGVDLIAWLVGLGLRVSLGHSGATCEQGMAAIAAGARQATHLFNRMTPLHHREPGLAGAVLQSDDVVAELICDAVHVHPAMVRLVVAAKKPSRVMAVTDGTAAAGLPTGGSACLGGQTITAADSCARLADGTMAGSTLTMDGAFRRLTGAMGFSLVDAATMCATTPARELGLIGHGVLAEGAAADLVVLDRAGEVVQTYVRGRLVYAKGASQRNGATTESD